MEFSPAENYLVTYSSKDPSASHVFWNVVTGERVKAFPREQGFQQFWWSHDDKYFARLNVKEGVVSVYEAPACKLIPGGSVRLSHDIAAFKWSPSDNTIACYVPEIENKPARVVLVRYVAFLHSHSQNSSHFHEISLELPRTFRTTLL